MRSIVRRLAVLAGDFFVCIYCGGYTGTYDDVQAHQAVCDRNGNRR